MTLRLFMLICCFGLLIATNSVRAQPQTYEIGKDGLTIDDKLTKNDPGMTALKGAPPHKVFLVKMTKDQTYLLELSSKDFNTIVIVEKEAGTALAFDDDLGELDSRIRFTPREDGVFRVLATTCNIAKVVGKELSYYQKVGEFRLRVHTTDAEPAIRIHEISKNGLDIKGHLSPLDPKLGALKGAPFKEFPINLKKGQQYAIELKSVDFDAYLIVERNGKTLAQDDDSGGGPRGLDSRIIFQATENAVYRIFAASFDRQYGRFQLIVREADPATEKLTNEIKRFVAAGTASHQKGDLDAAIRHFRDALKLRKELYPVSQYPQGHLEVAVGLRQLASLHFLRNQFVEAQQYFEQELAMFQKLFPVTEHPQGHFVIAASLMNIGVMLEAQGKYPAAQSYFERSLAMTKNLYPPEQYPQGHIHLAQSLNFLGGVLVRQEDYDSAQPYLERALAMRQKLYPVAQYPNGHDDLATSLNNLGILIRSRGQFEAARPYYEKALEMRKELYPAAQYPQGHYELAMSFHNMAILLESLGQYESAQSHLEQALAMKQKLFPKSQYPHGHPTIIGTLRDLSKHQGFLGRYETARRYCEEALAMAQKLYPATQFPQGHPDLAQCLNEMAELLLDQAQYESAQTYQEQAVAMEKKLYPALQYPKGHRNVVAALCNLGVLLQYQSKYDEALKVNDQAMEMWRKLYPAAQYPQGDRNVTAILGKLGYLCRMQRQYEAAHQFVEQALEMEKNLFPTSRYPDGHPSLAEALSHFAGVLRDEGEYEAAQKFYEQTLAMQQKLYPELRYPDGHPGLVEGLAQVGYMLEQQGQQKEAERYHQQSVMMNQKLIAHFVATATESEALERLAQRPLRYSDYLSLTLHLPGSDERAHAVTWASRHVVTRLMEQRHASARAAGTAHVETLELLRANRRRTEGLLQDSKMKLADRNEILDKLSRDRESLERDLAKSLPIFEQWKARDGWTPKDLARTLPAGTAFVDVIRYTRFQQVPNLKGINDQIRMVPSYAAFIVTAGNSSVRVELGAAKSLDESVAKWLKSIDTQRNAETPPELVDAWAKIAKHLPDSTRILYIAPDGSLAKIPWAALPGRKSGTVLLEQFEGGMATVPHGVFLLEALKHPARVVQGDLVAIGDVDFGKSDWPELPGTATELRAIAPLASGKSTTIAGKDATLARLAKELPAAAFAHFATHGFFDEKELASQKKHELKLQDARGFGEFGAAKVAWKNPAAFTGLVLSGGEVMTGLALIDLPLENLQLVTLSACETGLGELTAGEGVQGLQRAFHVAGCPNVVASLWKVNDAATAALMTKFYHELWVNKKAPMAALREAQLAVYRSSPEQIEALAGLRGRPKLDEAVRVALAPPAAGASGRTPTRLWASFVLSGAGR